MKPENNMHRRFGGARHRNGSTEQSELAIGGLSLDDFRQDALLAEIETEAQNPGASADGVGHHASERVARKNFRQHEDRERKRASIRSYQTVPIDSGWRRAGRDRHRSAPGRAVSSYDTELFGQIRPDNSRHPKPKSGTRAATPLARVLEEIVDNGLERNFLCALKREIATRAQRDPALIRHYALLVVSSGFEVQSMRPIDDVDDDRMLMSGDNKRIAERLTSLGFATTTRDVENTKKRLDRLLLEVATRVLGGTGSNEQAS